MGFLYSTVTLLAAAPGGCAVELHRAPPGSRPVCHGNHSRQSRCCQVIDGEDGGEPTADDTQQLLVDLGWSGS
ncbi:hypothetical protein INR49_020219 [Caranx melampygus]|nr:hypothetical protein INR49_020219 [Caranx melampygus]